MVEIPASHRGKRSGSDGFSILTGEKKTGIRDETCGSLAGFITHWNLVYDTVSLSYFANRS